MPLIGARSTSTDNFFSDEFPFIIDFATGISGREGDVDYCDKLRRVGIEDCKAFFLLRKKGTRTRLCAITN